MWYLSVSQDQQEPVPAKEIVAGSEQGRQTNVRRDVESGDANVSAGTPTSSTTPGSEYWLP